MALPIDIEDLLNKRKVESNRIEFKEGWNPTSIYHSICAFANDIDNIGGGYILVGVEEENGIAKRPVKGLAVEQLDKIQREILQFNNMIEPFYSPRLSVEDIDGQSVMVIWVPTGHNRPYTVPRDVLAKLKKPTYYIRYGTSSIEAKGEFLDQLRDMANRVPFDDRGNEAITINDISPILLKDYLTKVGSRLAQENFTSGIENILEQMNLLDGPTERHLIKNVAAMMFAEHPEKFFNTTQVDIVVFPEGREDDPENFIEVPVIKGPVPMMIRETLNYLRTNIIKERIQKQLDDEHSVKVFNYPFQALEEAVVNALYHRDYKEREPVEITIEPDKISILSYSGPDRSISLESIREAKVLRSRRYRNRRLGEFLKELDLTEGRATGIPTIQKKLSENGSPKATIKTDEARTYFLIDIPCRTDFVQDVSKIKDVDIERVKMNMSKICPRYVQDVSMMELENLAICLLRARTEISAQEMLEGIDNVSYKQKRRKYLDRLVYMGAILMKMPDKPTSKLQKYILSELGKNLLSQ
ncbi:MAG: putative DNA binding domain-containing protein [Prevotellaceae bacterium]|nr:putative DNA binding domain-containing protein [Candidatus Faecinaster equi]